MTSPYSKIFASAELTPELDPLSSPPSSSQVSVTDGSPYPPATLSFPPPAIRLAPIGYPQSLRGRKGTTSSTKSRIQKSQRDCQVAKSPAGQSLARRGHGSSRTPASGRPDAGPRPLFQARELPRLSADQNPVPSDPPSSRHSGNGDRTMRPSSTSISAFNVSFPSPTLRDSPRASSPTGPRSNALDGMVLAAAADPTSSCGSRSADRPLQIAYSTPLLFHPQIAGFSPSLPTKIPVDPPRFPVNLSTGHYTYPKQNILSNASSPSYPHRTIPLPLPIGPTPSQPHESLSRQSPPFSSAASDGFKILREAVPIVLVRILVSRLDKGLPVNAYSETHLEYVTPLQGHLLRDVFNSVSPPPITSVLSVADFSALPPSHARIPHPDAEHDLCPTQDHSGWFVSLWRPQGRQVLAASRRPERSNTCPHRSEQAVLVDRVVHNLEGLTSQPPPFLDAGRKLGTW